MSSRPPCRCARPSVHAVISLAPDGAAKRTAYVCGDEECEWKVHCEFLELPYQRPLGVALPPRVE